MSIKQIYSYLFYKLYKFWERVSVPKFWSDWKSGISMLALEIWLLVSVMVYYKVFTKRDLINNALRHPLTFIILAILIMIKLMMFEHQDRWKKYVIEFDKWPKRKNRKGTIVVWSVIILIVANLIFSYYLMSKIDWAQYR